jgi:uncharacterized protein Usg
VTTQDFQKQVDGYGLTTANILYRRPDHPWLLQSYVWQNYDLYPDFPELQSFLEFWQNLSKVSCMRSRLRVPTLSNRSRSKQWMVFPGFTDRRPHLISDRFHSVGLDRLGSWASSMLRSSESFAATLS